MTSNLPRLGQDVNDALTRLDPHPNVPPRHYADAIVSAGWLPPKGTG